MIDAGPAHATFKGAFPPDATYRVGQCASGWIPFFTRGTLTTIKYSNGVGDVAIWDADRLDRKPEIRAKSSPTPQRSTAPTRRLVTPGAFCTPRALPAEPAPEPRWPARARTETSHGGDDKSTSTLQRAAQHDAGHLLSCLPA